MKKARPFALLLCLAMLCGMLGACGGGASSSLAPASSSSATPVSPAAEGDAASLPESTSTAGGLTLTDMMGQTITLNAPATKVVALTAADCEIIYALGAGDLLVGRGEYCNYPEEVLALPALSSGAETNVEQIIALQPDVVFMSSMAQKPEQVTQLQNAGIAVIVSEAPNIAGTYESIGLVGIALGKEAEAGELVAHMMEGFAALQAQVPANAAGGTAYFEVSPLEWGLWTAGNNTFIQELAEMVGLENVFADVDGWAEISQEQVIERNPAYIFTTSAYMGEGPTPDEEIMAREGWGSIAAVESGSVYAVDNDAFARPGPRLLDAAQQLFALVYGEAAQAA